MEMDGFVTLDSCDPAEAQRLIAIDLTAELQQWSQGLGLTGETVSPESAVSDTDEQVILGYCNF